MRFFIATTILVFSSIAPVMAITVEEIAPQALRGKTLTFTIESAGGGFAASGTWTGSFGETSFTATRVTGDTVNVTTTYTAVDDSFIVVTLPVFIQGSGETTLTLYVKDAVGRYEMNFNPVDSAFQIGTFTIATTPPAGPEISLQQPVGTELADGRSKKNFGSVQVGKTSKVKTFTVKNTGTTQLTGLAISRGGKNPAEFTTSKLSKTRLAPGASLTFTAAFKPKSKALGVKTSMIKIKSNDSDENPFDIPITGTTKK